jgi:hypothetical protein
VAHHYVPFLWTANGAMSLAKGNTWPAVLGVAGSFLIGGLGLRRAYRSTIRFYQGQATIKRSKRRPKREKVAAVERNFLERQLPGIPEEAAALALAFFRSLARAPEVKMMLAGNVIMLLVFGVLAFSRRSAILSDHFTPFIATGTVAITFFGMLQLMFNQFGCDRGGFRTLVLSPVPRKQILLGKNLAFLPIAVGIGVIMLLLVKFVLRVPFIFIFAAILQLVAAFSLLSMAGNLTSVLAPYRIAPGSLKPTKASAMTTILILLTHFLFPIVLLPIFFPPALGLLLSSLGWLPAAPTNLFFSVVVLTLFTLFYWLSLGSLGKLLQQREMEILRVVTQEVE